MYLFYVTVSNFRLNSTTMTSWLRSNFQRTFQILQMVQFLAIFEVNESIHVQDFFDVYITTHRVIIDYPCMYRMGQDITEYYPYTSGF
jgi:hypothetical protein